MLMWDCLEQLYWKGKKLKEREKQDKGGMILYLYWHHAYIFPAHHYREKKCLLREQRRGIDSRKIRKKTVLRDMYNPSQSGTQQW